MFKKLLAGAFPQLRRTLDFGEFHPELAGNTVEVWLNPSIEARTAWQNYYEALTALPQDGPMTDELRGWRNSLFAQLWGCEDDDAGTLLEMVEAQPLAQWLIRRSWELVGEYAQQRGKAASG